jgi:hypothetical protein
VSRVEILAGIHKALRWASHRAVTELGACIGDSAAIATALAHTRELLAIQEAHQRIEDATFIPAIEARKPGAAARLAEAHADHENSIERFRNQIAAVELDPTRHALHSLYLEVTRFVGDNFLHMYEEETLAEPLLHEVYSDAELEALVGRAKSMLTPTEIAVVGPILQISGGLR